MSDLIADLYIWLEPLFVTIKSNNVKGRISSMWLFSSFVSVFLSSSLLIFWIEWSVAFIVTVHKKVEWRMCKPWDPVFFLVLLRVRIFVITCWTSIIKHRTLCNSSGKWRSVSLLNNFISSTMLASSLLIFIVDFLHSTETDLNFPYF